MVALNFKKEFADDVEEGRKLRTIRQPRKDGRDVKRGDALQLYTGLRTVSCRKLRDAACIRSQAVSISATEVSLDGRLLPVSYNDEFAQADGFEKFTDMTAFFEKLYGLPFTGVLIEWGDDY